MIECASNKGIRRAPFPASVGATTDNPNVWYELGFDYAAGQPVILTCCDDLEGALPYDIRHPKVIQPKSSLQSATWNELARRK